MTHFSGSRLSSSLFPSAPAGPPAPAAEDGSIAAAGATFGGGFIR